MTGKYDILINRKWCKNCGICAAYCPQKALEINEMKVLTVIAAEKCVGCRLCEFRCPDMAVTVVMQEDK